VILVTVGAQMPFDRLVRAVDLWAGRCGRGDVFAQIGPTEWRPRNIGWATFLSPAEFRARVEASTLLIAHAGMGSILTALELGKPILVMPRRGALMETRNDHQVATARLFAQQGRIAVAMDESDLAHRLESMQSVSAAPPISRFASPELLSCVRSFIAGGDDCEAAASAPHVVTRRVRLTPLEHHEHV
jgi:UDP-N-acetylglucosamine transferase subunit ALG13